MGKSLSFSKLSEKDNNGLGMEYDRKTGIKDGAIFWDGAVGSIELPSVGMRVCGERKRVWK